jgi:hypothetical protein
VARDFLITTRGGLSPRKDSEGHADVLHLLCNCVSPEGVAIDAVEVIGLLNGLGYFNTVFVGPAEVTRLALANEGDNSLSSAEDVVGPPVKGGLVVNASGLGIFGGLNRVGLF